MISTYLNGRFGNNLFQYVFCRISADKNKCNFYIPSTKEESNMFYYNISRKLGTNLQSSVIDNPHYWLGSDIFDIDFGKNDNNINKLLGDCDIQSVVDGCFLNGFFQTDSYMVGYEDVIIDDWLKINEVVINNSVDIINMYNPIDYCYIHFRGGDYKNIPQYFLPIDYYNDSIKKIKSINTNVKFLVITDDISEAKKYFPDFDVISNTMEIDFYLLTQSKYSIIPNSSFSWWASWLNKNSSIIIAPNNWFNYNGYYGEGFSPPNVKSDKFYYI
jgi:hypothetical protein